MSHRPTVLVVLAILCVPPALALLDGAAYRAANRSNATLVSSGIEREYLLHLPPGLDRARPVPLVLSLHGAGGWPAMQRDISRWSDLADREGFIVAYPSGVAGKGPRAFEMGWPDAARDIRYVADLIDAVAARHPIDRRRVYANGLSNGGGMSFVLSCALADRLAAVGLVVPALLTPWSACHDLRPVPMIAFHGTEDRFVGSRSWIAPPGMAFANIPEFVATWSRRNQCAAEPIDARVAADVSRRSYHGCASSAEVVLYTLDRGGHTWPGGAAQPEWLLGRMTRSIDATRLMWEFFQRHPLP